MAKTRLNFRLSARQKSLIEQVAAKLEMNKSEVMRHIINYGLNSLLKFETGGKIKLKDLLNPETEEQEIQDQINLNKLKEQIELANTKFLSD